MGYTPRSPWRSENVWRCFTWHLNSFKTKTYSLWLCQNSELERSTIFNGKIHYKWPFSIAMLVYQRVLVNCHKPIPKITILRWGNPTFSRWRPAKAPPRARMVGRSHCIWPPPKAPLRQLRWEKSWISRAFSHTFQPFSHIYGWFSSKPWFIKNKVVNPL